MSKESPIGRRTFLTGALATTAAVALPLGILSGCTSAKGNTPSSHVTIGLSDKERATVTADPSYMGSNTNFCGQEVVLGTGTNGETANQALLDQQAKYLPAHLVKVTDRVYSAIGNALANSTMIIGNTGIIIIDTGECKETAALDLELFRTITDKPVVAVIYTHCHYTGGTTAYLPAGNPDKVPIIAQERFMEALLSPFTETATSYVDRAHIMFGDYLPLEGEDGRTSCGIGPFYSNPYVDSFTPGFIPPNKLIPVSEKDVVEKIDGLTFHFYPTASDSADNINIYVEEEKTIITNQAWGTMYNMYTLRGEKYRDPIKMIKALDTLRGLNADNLVSVHALPLLGKSKVDSELTLQRDAMQFVYDQTVRYLNKGYTPDQIVAAIKIPAFMASGDITKPLYGEFEHYVRGVYGGIIGWFNGSALELHPVSKAHESAYLVKLAGGTDAVIADAKSVLEDAQYAWAATLATHVLNIDEQNAEAKSIKAQAFRKMGQISQASNTRHWYHTEAWQLEGKLDKTKVAPVITKDKLMAAPRTLVLDMLRVSIDPTKAEGMNEALTITYTDEGISTSMSIRNCIGAVTEGKANNSSAELKIPYTTMLDIVTGARTFDDCLNAGEASIEGDQTKFKSIMGVCEMQL
ncbi:MAG: alkyl sulfatase dimerization domain-containing protein [Gordonibacter sp.]|nr:alkyl sulfatase dimerization domain-containing protein [Gordonibacter sp.]